MKTLESKSISNQGLGKVTIRTDEIKEYDDLEEDDLGGLTTIDVLVTRQKTPLRSSGT